MPILPITGETATSRLIEQATASAKEAVGRLELLCLSSRQLENPIVEQLFYENVFKELTSFVPALFQKALTRKKF